MDTDKIESCGANQFTHRVADDQGRVRSHARGLATTDAAQRWTRGLH